MCYHRIHDVHLATCRTPNPLPNSLSLSHSDDAPKKKEKADAGETTAAVEESKRKRVNLIDAKRGQNAGIALARIKVGFPEVRER